MEGGYSLSQRGESEAASSPSHHMSYALFHKDILVFQPRSSYKYSHRRFHNDEAKHFAPSIHASGSPLSIRFISCGSDKS